jgi:hypothetical protein
MVKQADCEPVVIIRPREWLKITSGSYAAFYPDPHTKPVQILLGIANNSAGV